MSTAHSTNRAISIPMKNIFPLLQDFTASYRALMILAMTNAFGYTAPHIPHTSGDTKCSYETPQDKMVLFITLRGVPKLSVTTKGRAAFLIEDAEALTFDALREASKNKMHRLYDEDNAKLLQSFDKHVEGMNSMRLSTMSRHSMCLLKLDFSNEVERSIFLKDFYYSDDPSVDCSSRWRPDNWLKYLKEEVAKGKGWEPVY
ncbi:hypothetical protein FIBSPDRAFT_1042028 [Athelia psychrophila]|uniref:Uncharacterized protein n=1 Tax=Athelia psychrophila TaxID=1759441 RepID=A0A166N1U3_9AGAM|nr:hypothetical protein FIBSPDRAFT_1042028 [Fibularhizoctonia sp. CBS 109695]